MLAWLALTFSLVIAPSLARRRHSADLQAAFGGIRGLPTTFLIDRHRTIRYKAVGFEYAAMVEHALKPLL